MTGTANLAIQYISDGNDSEDRAGFFKDAQDDMDAILTEDFQVAIDGTNAGVVSTANFQRNIFFLLTPNGISADPTVTVPSIKRGVFVIVNLTAFDAVIETAAQVQDSPIVPAGQFAVLTCDGTDVVDGMPRPYEVGKAVMGEPGDAEVILRHAFAEKVRFPAGLTDSGMRSVVAATAQADIDIQRDGVSVGTIRFAAAGDVASFIMASETDFDVDQIMTWIAPSPQDATLADLVGTLLGKRI